MGVFRSPPSKINRVVKVLENVVQMSPARTQQEEQEDSDCVIWAGAQSEFMNLINKKEKSQNSVIVDFSSHNIVSYL